MELAGAGIGGVSRLALCAGKGGAFPPKKAYGKQRRAISGAGLSAETAIKEAFEKR